MIKMYRRTGSGKLWAVVLALHPLCGDKSRYTLNAICQISVFGQINPSSQPGAEFYLPQEPGCNTMQILRMIQIQQS